MATDKPTPDAIPTPDEPEVPRPGPDFPKIPEPKQPPTPFPARPEPNPTPEKPGGWTWLIAKRGRA
jgi:hypothetical protein